MVGTPFVFINSFINLRGTEGIGNVGVHVPIDTDLLALVGIHPENPVEDDKVLIREIIARRLPD